LNPPECGVTLRPDDANVAFLLIHGFCAAPDEVSSLGQFLAEKGISSYAVRIAGHETSPEDLSKKSRLDWFKSVSDGLDVVKSWNPKHLFVAGFSMGGALALKLASNEDDINGIVLISPAVRIFSTAAKFLPLLKLFVKFKSVDLEQIQKTHGYDLQRTKYAKEPLSAYSEFLKMTKDVRSVIHRVTMPALIMQGTDDKTISPKNARIVYDGISSSIKEIHMIEGAEHVIPCHPTRSIAYAHIPPFIERVTASARE
jgi:carboxylesterase